MRKLLSTQQIQTIRWGTRRSCQTLILYLGVCWYAFGTPLLAQQAQDLNPAMNNPDRFAWDLFVEVNRPALARTRGVFDPTAAPMGGRAYLSWFGRNRRLAKDWENLADTLHAFVTIASIQLAVRRLARK
jgi:hypothetical protein